MRVPFRSPPRIPPLAGDTARWVAPFLVAVMIYIAGLAGIGLILVDQTLRDSRSTLAGRLTVVVPADASAARLETILAVLRQTPSIRSVHLLSTEETGRLLEPWLGAPASIEELPVPRLIDAGLDPAADIATLRTQLASVVPDIRIDDYGPEVSGLRAGALPLQALFGMAIGAALLLVAALAVSATRAALASRRTDIELLHRLGAEERQIARPYIARSLAYGLIGGGIAAAAILSTIAALEGAIGGAGSPIRFAAPAGGVGPADGRLWAVLAIMTAAAGILAAASARAAVRRRLAHLP